MPPPYLPPPEVETALRAAAVRRNVPITLLRAVAYIESRFDTGLTSARGAKGLMQLMPATLAHFKVDNPMDAVQSADAGANLLGRLLNATSWNIEETLQAYVWGPTRFAQARTAGAAVPGDVKAYAKRVIAVQYYYRMQVEKPPGTLMHAINAAIESIAGANPDNIAATQLREDWRAYYAARQDDSDESAILNPMLRKHWNAYTNVYHRAAIDDVSPLPELIEPDFWAKAVVVVDKFTKKAEELGEQVLSVGAIAFLVLAFYFVASNRRSD